MILATADNHPQMKNTDRYDLYFSLKDSIFSIINFHQREQKIAETTSLTSRYLLSGEYKSCFRTQTRQMRIFLRMWIHKTLKSSFSLTDVKQPLI
ncbi:hypothetical protein DQT76_16405 [Salmonella enterica subsp. diarizonae]|nr:hypothetical protein [Salmonella enterica subsp. diarizonae]